MSQYGAVWPCLTGATGRSATLLAACFISTSAAACSDTTAPQEPDDPPLIESIPWSALGDGRILFRRISSDESSTQAQKQMMILIDPSAMSAQQTSASHPADLSPEGGRIVFTRLSFSDGFRFDFSYLKLADRTEHHVGFIHSLFMGFPTWTADGSAIVFPHASFFSAQVDRIAVDVPGAQPVTIAYLVPFFDEDKCSDPGERVSYSITGSIAITCYGGAEIKIFRQGEMLQLYAVSPPEGDVRGKRISSPVWNAAGTHLAFIEQELDEEGLLSMMTLRIMRVSDRAVHTVHQRALNVSVSESMRSPSVCWLAGGQRLAFTMVEPNQRGSTTASNIYSVGLDGTGLTRITNAPAVIDGDLSCAHQSSGPS